MTLRQLLPALLLLWSLPVAAQHTRAGSIGLSYDDVSVGRNINATYHRLLSAKWYVYGGVKWHINSDYYKNDYTVNTYLFKQFYARNPTESIGLKAGLERLWQTGNQSFQVFSYYDFQFTQASIRSLSYYWNVGEFPRLDHPTADKRQYFYSFENTLGIGAKFLLSNRLDFIIKAGAGINYYSLNKADAPLPKSSFGYYSSWTFSRQLSVGLRYNLLRKGISTFARAENASKRDLEAPDINQNSITFSYDDIQTGSHVNLGYKFSLPGDFGIYASIKYHISSRFHRDFTITAPYYFKQFRPKSYFEHLGVIVGLEKSIRIPRCRLIPFAFYETQVMRSTVTNLAHLNNFGSGILSANGFKGIDQHPDNYNALFRHYGPVTAFENYIGVGARFSISNKINLKMKGGIGYNIYIGPDIYQAYDIYNTDEKPPSNTVHLEHVPWTAKQSEISRMFSIGLEYKLKRY